MKVEKTALIVLLLSAAFLFYITSCKKVKKLPSLTTTEVTFTTSTSVSTGGNISDDGGASITCRGICWSLSPDPTISDMFILVDGSTGNFVYEIHELDYETTYYVRAFAMNEVGTQYGNTVTFTTDSESDQIQPHENAPVVTTNLTVADITNSTAMSGGTITDDKGLPVISRGICWSRNPEPTINSNKTEDGSGTGIFTSTMSLLSPFTTYYVRAYAINSQGVGYGNVITFKTLVRVTFFMGDKNGLPINDGLITINNDIILNTSTDGKTHIDLPEGNYSLTASKSGYDPITMGISINDNTDNSNINIDFGLNQSQ